MEDLSRALCIMKNQYKEALTNLEAISEEVHARRRTDLAIPTRTPVVGADPTADQSDLPSINLGALLWLPQCVVNSANDIFLRKIFY